MKTRLLLLGILVPVTMAVAVGCARSQEEAKQGSATTEDTTSTTTNATTEQNAKGLLDGRQFTGSYTENGEKMTDTLSFDNGHFRSAGCDMYGFDHPEYTATANGDQITFSAHAMSDKEGMMQWTGTVDGKELTGKYVWTKEGQNPSTVEFTITEL